MKSTWIASLTSLVALTAFADDMTSSAHRTFSQLDTNSDGRVTTSEAAAYERFNAAFKTSDQNGDGWISESEYDTWMRDRPSDASTSPAGQTRPGQSTNSEPATTSESPTTGQMPPESTTETDTDQTTTLPSN
jgi:Ca2+-binding EF-hand superfamily protein